MKKQDLQLDKFLPYRLSIASSKVSSDLAKVYSEKFNIGVPEWRVIAVVGQESGLSADEVCSRTGMEKVAVSRAVAKLLEKSLLARQFSNKDRRRSELSLSAKGRKTYEEIIPLALRFQEALLSEFSMDDVEKMVAILEEFSKDSE